MHLRIKFILIVFAISFFCTKNLLANSTLTSVLTPPQIVSNNNYYSHNELWALFTRKGINFPPKRVAYVAIKDEKILELWAKDNGEYKYIKAFPIWRTSGLLGPKLKQGDKQVPEGIYALTKLNPNSQYHMSIKIDYPNALDKYYAKLDRRYNLGGSIFLHGGIQSVGCLAVGNKVIEQIYALTKFVGAGNSKIVITPTDFRKKQNQGSSLLNLSDKFSYYVENKKIFEPKNNQYALKPVWINDLYSHIKNTLSILRHPRDIRPAPKTPYKRYKIFED